jgi:hypothetical protein
LRPLHVSAPETYWNEVLRAIASAMQGVSGHLLGDPMPAKLKTPTLQPFRTKNGKADNTESHLDLNATVALWLIGALIVIHLMLRFPDLGALVERYNQF